MSRKERYETLCALAALLFAICTFIAIGFWSIPAAFVWLGACFLAYACAAKDLAEKEDK